MALAKRSAEFLHVTSDGIPSRNAMSSVSTVTNTVFSTVTRMTPVDVDIASIQSIDTPVEFRACGTSTACRTQPTDYVRGPKTYGELQTTDYANESYNSGIQSFSGRQSFSEPSKAFLTGLVCIKHHVIFIRKLGSRCVTFRTVLTTP